MNKSKTTNVIEILLLIITPATLLFFAFFQIEQSALLTLAVATISIILFLFGYERSKPAIKQIVPTAVLGALAAAGRILFAAVPNFKPVCAICIIGGIVFGRRSGFLIGCLAALVSNFFFGQGAWTPWQMYSWGLVGYISGVLADHKLHENRIVLYSWAFLSPLLYGFILNSWYIVGFVQPITLQSALLTYGAGIPLDIIQSIATVIFLAALFEPWKKKLTRIKEKFGVE